MNKNDARDLALGMATLCVRNTYLEDLHSGTTPHSKRKDFSDVNVVTPEGTIPWNELSRINNDEMRRLMKEVINKIYSILLHMDDPQIVEQVKQYGHLFSVHWDEPEFMDLFKKKIRI